MKKDGAKVWYFPDGYLPEKKGAGPLEAHEALMLLNVQARAASVTIDFYFETRPAVKGIKVKVPAERVICVRLDKPEAIGGVRLGAMEQYAMRVRSSIPIVAQFGRLDTTQTNMAYYCAPGIWGDA